MRKHKILVYILAAAMLATGCSAKSADTNETSSEVATETEISSEETETEKETEIDGETEEETETEAETESGTEETPKEEMEDTAEETEEEASEEETGEEVEETETTTEATTEATTEETTAATVQSVSASVDGTHYIGENLTGSDFTVTVTFSDGSTLINPEGWAAAPLELTASSNVITVYYESVSTTIEVSAETAPETTTAVPETTTAAADTSYLQVVDTSTAMYTYDSMVEDLNQLAAAYPDIIDLESAGTTADGRTIYVVYFGNRNASQQIFICAATHAREYMTSQLVMKQLEFYSGCYDSGSYNGRTFREIFSDTCFVIVPMVNPDGVSISQLGEAGIRDESLRANLYSIYQNDVANGYTTYDYAYYLVRWKANARGVDINRNFSPGWESVTDRSAPSSSFYKGTEPGSEAETQALMNIVNSLSNPLMVISYHSYGNLVYWQYGQSEPLWSANQSLAQNISNMTGQYLSGYSNEAGFSNWCLHVKGIRSVTVETGTVDCPLPISQFSMLWSQYQYVWPMLAGL